MQLIMSGILNMMQLVGVASSVWTMDSAGRRVLLLTGSVFMTLAQVVIATLVRLYGEDWPGHRQQGWTSVAFLLFYMLVFGCSWGPVPWAMPSGKPGYHAASCRVASYNVSYRNLPFLSPLQRCGPLNLFELAEQLHHRESMPHLLPSVCLIDTFSPLSGPNHSASGPHYGIRSLRVFCHFLCPLICVDIPPCSRDEGTQPGANGRCFR